MDFLFLISLSDNLKFQILIIDKIKQKGLFIYFSFVQMKGKGVKLKEQAIIREKIQAGVPPSIVASEHKLHITTIYQFVREKMKKQRKRGRPTKLSPNDHQNLVRKICDSPTTTAVDLQKKLQLPVSPATICQELVRNSFHHEHLQPVESISSVNCQKRLDFVCSHVSWTNIQWNTVIFSDKKKWNLVGNDGYVSAWVENHKTYHQEEVKCL